MSRNDLSMPLRDAIYGRHSVRAFSPAPVEAAEIRALLDAAVHAPTAVHEEPWAFLVIQDGAVLQRLSDHAKAHYRADIEAGRHAEPVAALFAHADSNLFYNAGTLIVICAKPLGPFVVADCWLAAENLMLAAHGLGLGSCVIGSAVSALNLPEEKEALGIPAGYTAVAPIIVGTPSGYIAESPRKRPEVLGWK